MSDASSLFTKARQASAAGRDLDARLALAAGITQLAGLVGVKPIVVGGTAVDFYAASATPRGLEPNKTLRASQDVDVITVTSFGADPAALRQALAKNPDFTSEETAIPVASRRKWWLKGAPLLVEILGGELYGDPERVVELDVAGGQVFLWAPEDTAWQYMQVALSERSRTSWERAVAIAAAQANEAWQWDYLRSRADALAPVALVEALQAGDSFDEMQERCA